MIKVISVFRRKKGMSVDEFQSYWRNQHAEIVCRMPRIRRYVQSHTLISGYRNRTPACDGVAELTFDNSDALRALANSLSLNDVRADHAKFMDLSSYKEIVTEDVVIKNGTVPLDGVKNIELVARKATMEPEQFHRYWVDVHGPLAVSIGQIQRYVQSHTRISAYANGGVPVLDGVALTWFSDTDAMRAAAVTEAYARTRADEDNFVSVPLEFVITKEHVVVS